VLQWNDSRGVARCRRAWMCHCANHPNHDGEGRVALLYLSSTSLEAPSEVVFKELPSSQHGVRGGGYTHDGFRNVGKPSSITRLGFPGARRVLRAVHGCYFEGLLHRGRCMMDRLQKGFLCLDPVPPRVGERRLGVFERRLFSLLNCSNGTGGGCPCSRCFART
jgi:hypothetical protein